MLPGETLHEPFVWRPPDGMPRFPYPTGRWTPTDLVDT